MIDTILFWVIGVVTWWIVFIWNADSWNKSRGPLKTKGIFKPAYEYAQEHGLYVVGSFLVCTVLLLVAAFDELPVKVLIGDDVSAGKLFMAIFIAFNTEALVNAIRRSKSDNKEKTP